MRLPFSICSVYLSSLQLRLDCNRKLHVICLFIEHALCVVAPIVAYFCLLFSRFAFHICPLSADGAATCCVSVAALPPPWGSATAMPAEKRQASVIRFSSFALRALLSDFSCGELDKKLESGSCCARR